MLRLACLDPGHRGQTAKEAWPLRMVCMCAHTLNMCTFGFQHCQTDLKKHQLCFFCLSMSA